ncbi:MAG: hypothetical protein V2B19_27285 [Pseudomonadota bacterium]
MNRLNCLTRLFGKVIYLLAFSVFALTTIQRFAIAEITPISMDITGTFASNEPVSFTVVGANSGSEGSYYKFFYCPKYGTSAYDSSHWVVMQAYSTQNTCRFTFPEDGDYVVVARVVADPDNEPDALPIIGGVVPVGHSDNIHIAGLSSNAVGPVAAGRPVTLTVEASNAAGEAIYYKWFYRADYGTSDYDTSPWIVVQDYATTNICNYTFPSAGHYIVVVRAVTDPNNEPADPRIIGAAMVCTPPDESDNSTVVVGTGTWTSGEPGAAQNEIWLRRASGYSSADLQGSWAVHGLASGPGAPYWERGTAVIQSNGSFQLSVIDNKTNSKTASGTLQIVSDGTLTQNGRADFKGNLDAGKTVIAITDIWDTISPGTTEMKIWMKQSAAYSVSDLTGTWEMHGLATGPGTQWWERGMVTVQSNGSFQASVVDNEGESDTISGKFNIATDGAITLEGRDSWEFKGNIDAGKTVIVSTDSWTTGSPGSTEMKLWVKQEASRSLSDLQGSWAVHGLASRASNRPWWIRGALDIQSDGAFQVTLYEHDEQNDLEVEFGRFSLSSGGKITRDGDGSFSGNMD